MDPAVSPPPAPPPGPPPFSRARSCLFMLVAAMAMLFAAGLLLFLPTGFIGPFVVFGGLAFGGLMSFHYLVWGRWMERVLQEERDRAGQEESPD